MSRSRAKGTAFESAVCEWLRGHGFPYAERRAMRGVRDAGDIAGLPGVVLEVKNCARFEPAAFVDEAAVEALNAGVPIFAAVVKRRGRSDPGEAFALMPLRVLAALLRDDETEAVLTEGASHG